MPAIVNVFVELSCVTSLSLHKYSALCLHCCILVVVYLYMYYRYFL